MNNLEIFKNSNFGELRTITDEYGQPWFIGKDVAKALGFTNTRDAIKTHVFEEDKGVDLVDTLGGRQKMTVVNESGLYALVFGSQLEDAKKFKHWVTHEVLPAIRKDGGYMVTKEGETEEELIARALILAQKSIDRLELENKQKDQIIGELRPKADYTDKILQSTSVVTITSIAKDYGLSGSKMNKLLHELGIQYKQGNQWLIYAKYHDKGYTHSETVEFPRSDGSLDVNMITKWTQKGRLFLYNELKDNGYLPMIERI
jgi:hypothetical protein|nr:MAG TPA: repressor domain protein [Caudoviricetes sp.]